MNFNFQVADSQKPAKTRLRSYVYTLLIRFTLPMNYSNSQTWLLEFRLAPSNSRESQRSAPPTQPPFHFWRPDQHEHQQHSAGPSRTRDEQRNGRRRAAAPYVPYSHESLRMIARDHPISIHLDTLMGTNQILGRVGKVRRPPQESTSNFANHSRHDRPGGRNVFSPLSEYEVCLTGSMSIPQSILYQPIHSQLRWFKQQPSADIYTLNIWVCSCTIDINTCNIHISSCPTNFDTCFRSIDIDGSHRDQEKGKGKAIYTYISFLDCVEIGTNILLQTGLMTQTRSTATILTTIIVMMKMKNW